MSLALRSSFHTMQRPSLSSIALSGAGASSSSLRQAAEYDNTVDFGGGGDDEDKPSKKKDKKKTGGFQSFGQQQRQRWQRACECADAVCANA